MASIVLIETNCTVKTLKTKELTADSLYKKCGFRVNEDFLCRHTWRVKLAVETYTISVWAKKTGKANSENKYDFPSPIDKDLFFGTCAVVRMKDNDAEGTQNTFLDLTKETWLKIYEKLFGGFEDIGDEDEYSEDELANVDPALLTKNGYLKDGFVVSDKELTSGAPSTEEEEEDKIKEKGKKGEKKLVKKNKVVKGRSQAMGLEPDEQLLVKKKTRVTKSKKEIEKPKEVEVKEEDNDDSNSECTTSELEEEVYTFSDDD